MEMKSVYRKKWDVFEAATINNSNYTAIHCSYLGLFYIKLEKGWFNLNLYSIKNKEL